MNIDICYMCITVILLATSWDVYSKWSTDRISFSASFSAIYAFWQRVRWPQSSNGTAPIPWCLTEYILRIQEAPPIFRCWVNPGNSGLNSQGFIPQNSGLAQCLRIQAWMIPENWGLRIQVSRIPENSVHDLVS